MSDKRLPPKGGFVCEGERRMEVCDLYSNHHSWLVRWLYRKLGCIDVAADLAQDTFTRIIIRRNDFAIREPRSYLATVARGLVVDHFRRSSLEQAYLEVLGRLPEQEVPSPEQQVLMLDVLTEVDRLLDSLPGKARMAFLLAQLDGLPYAEIARLLGVTVSSVQKYMVRALRICYAAQYG